MKHFALIVLALFSISCAQKKDEFENDNTKEAASIVMDGENQNRTISPAGDRDWILFESPDPQIFNFKIYNCTIRLEGEIYVQKGLIPPVKLASFSVDDGDFSTNLSPDSKGVNYIIGLRPKEGGTGSYVVQINRTDSPAPQVVEDDEPSVNSSFNSYVAYDFDSFKNNMITDKSTDGGRNGTIDGSDPEFTPSPSGRGKVASFNGTWRIIVKNSTSEDFRMDGEWTMAFSLYYKKNGDFGNGLITRMTSNTGYCGFRGFLTLQGKGYEGFSFSSFDDSYIPDRPWQCNIHFNSLQPNKWTRVIIVHRRDQTGDIFINGEKIAENECMSIVEKGGKKLSIGGNYHNDHCYGEAFAVGVQIDDFVIIKKALDPKAIKSDGLATPIGF